MFDDEESTVDGDFSSLPREESDAYRESKVVTPDPDEKSLSDTDQVN
jgi:thiamine pyrophosphokinase